jgi:pimeloyl-ACP methyl ester carboxylesterase
MTSAIEEQVIAFTAGDGVPLRLTRLRGGTRGPVIVAPGIATSTRIFRIDTVERNLADSLLAAGYDLWLFDWRGSADLERREFTLDDVAQYDWPRVAAEVRERTGAQTVQIMAHCLASVSLLMALGGGYLDRSAVRNLVLTGVAAHIQVPRITEFKASMRLPNLLRRFGVRYADPRVAAFWDRSSPLTRSMDLALRVRFGDCPDDVCHRVSFIYGVLFQHENLAPETHASLKDLFGPAGLQTFVHLEQLVKAGHIRAFDYGARGNRERYGSARPPDYLEHPERFDVPVTFVHGELSRCFLPDCTRESYDLLRGCNGGPYERHVVSGYGHMDLLIGKDAARDVYPLIIAALDGYGGG